MSKSPDIPQNPGRRDFLTAGSKAAAASVLVGGASADRITPEPFSPQIPEDCVRPDRLWQYKRLCKEQIARLVDGDVDGAIKCLSSFLEATPTDPEYMYGLALAYTLKGDLNSATDYAQRAIDAGLPFGRFLAGPRELFAPLYNHAGFIKLTDKYGKSLIHGPLLGSVTESSAQFWVRTWKASKVRVLVSASNSFDVPTASTHATSQAATDFTAVVRIEGLNPDTLNYYQVEIDGELLPEIHSFKTHPVAGEPAMLSIGFGGCAGYTPWHERMWRTIAGHEFPLFLLTGDNVYIDDPTRPAVQDYTYYRRQSRPEFRDFVAGASIVAIWDDHEFGENDSWGGPEIDKPAWKLPVWRTFKNNWNNPGYGGGDEQPGCWFSFSIADIDIFMLDDRFYRDNHREPPTDRPATMLGPAQKTWLFDELRASTGTFKILVTSVPWAYGVKPNNTDPWQGFKEERDEIFDFLADNQIDGVFLLSGDRHRADIWKIDRPNGYPLYDFENARLTNLHTHQVLPGAIFGYNEKCTFGRLRFDTTLADPEVTYDIITIDDEVVHSFTLRHSELTG